MLEELAAAGNSSAAMLRRGAVYGELCSMPGKYGYQAAGVAKQWLAFGALLEFAEAHVDDEEEAVAEEKRSDAREKSPADGSGGKKRRRKDEKPEKKGGRPKKR